MAAAGASKSTMQATAMSELGQSRRFAPPLTTAGLPSTADITHRDHHFRKVPMADMQVTDLIKPSTSERSLGTPCQCFERLDERLRGERLCKKCDASRSQRSFANGRVLIPGNEDNRHGNACGFETMSQLDP